MTFFYNANYLSNFQNYRQSHDEYNGNIVAHEMGHNL